MLTLVLHENEYEQQKSMKTSLLVHMTLVVCEIINLIYYSFGFHEWSEE